MAIAEFGKQNYENALEYYQKLQKNYPHYNENIILRIAYCYFELGQYQKAKEQYLSLMKSKHEDVVSIAKRKIDAINQKI